MGNRKSKGEVVLDVEEKSDRSLCTHCSSISEDDEAVLRDLYYQIVFDRKAPRTVCQKFAWFWAQCCMCCFVYFCPPCPPCIIHKIAFAPPPKPSYDLVPFGPVKNGDYRILLSQPAKEIECRSNSPFAQYRFFFRGFFVEQLVTRSRIACVYCRSSIWESTASHRLTVLYSHTNAEDLGLMTKSIAELSVRASVDVVAYDYSGYGRSEGICSESNLYKNVESVYQYMVKEMKIPWRQLVAVGTSLGTAATIHLASKCCVRATVLQGSFSSAMRTMCPGRKDPICMDRFENVNKIRKVTRPTLFIHGKKDALFTVKHVELLRSRCPGAVNVEPLIIEEGEHFDFDEHAEYWDRLNVFLHEELIFDDRAVVGEPNVQKTSPGKCSIVKSFGQM